MLPELLDWDLGVVLVMALVVHKIGDYLLQPEWIALGKKDSWPLAALHVLLYMPLFLLLTLSPAALLVIGGSHLLIDRFRLAKDVIRIRNQLAPRHRRPDWKATAKTGFSPSVDDPTARGLVTEVDQILHISINSLALALL